MVIERMECENIVSNDNRTLVNKSLHFSQKRLDEFAIIYTQQLRKKVREIQAHKDRQFVNNYFETYDNSEVINENGESK